MARDLLHQSVRLALEKDGWNITNDPFFLYDKSLGINYDVDLGAEKTITAIKGTKKILVEVKSFARVSLRNEFHSILGQYLTYLLAMEVLAIEHELFLAIPNTVHIKLLNEPFLLHLIEYNKIKYFIYNDQKAEIISWKD